MYGSGSRTAGIRISRTLLRTARPGWPVHAHYGFDVAARGATTPNIFVPPCGARARWKPATIFLGSVSRSPFLNSQSRTRKPDSDGATEWTTSGVAGGGEDGVDGVAGGVGQMIAAHPVLALQVADHRLDGRAAFHLSPDGRRHTPLLAAGVDAHVVRGGCVVAAIAGIGDDACERGAGRALDVGDHGGKRVPVVGVAGQRLGVQHELATLAAAQGRGNADLDPELVGLVGFAFADALHLGRVQRINLASALTALLGEHAAGAE